MKKPDWEGFCQDLTALSRKHGIAVDGPTQTFAMRAYDYTFAYGMDADGRIALGWQDAQDRAEREMVEGGE